MADDIITRAAATAREVHAGQPRKGRNDVTYFEGHLEPVAALVAESGGSDTQIAAAYLHDAAEDAGGPAMLHRIADEVGPEVAEIVEHLSDSLVDTTSGEEKEDWQVRKIRYVQDLAEAPRSALQVSVADKVHNAEAILDDYDRLGPALWKLFNEERPERQLWYYASLDAVFRDRIPAHPLTGRLTRCLTALTDLIRSDVPDIDRRVADTQRELEASGGS
jgi:hypothetical protein